MSELPLGWIETTIGDVAEYVSRGKSPKYAAKSSLPVVNQRAIRWFGIQNEHLKFVHREQYPQWTSERFIRDGDVLWNSTGTGTIGRACLVKPEHLSPAKVVDSHVTIVRPRRDAIEPRYLFAWIRGPEVQRCIEDLATGTTNQIELSRSAVMGTRVPLAPLAEQRRIAEKLDALLARVDGCRERLGRVPGILKRFRQSVLAAATSGELTREWREARGVAFSWKTSTVAGVAAQVFDGPFGSHLKSKDYVDNGVRVVRLENIAPLRFVQDKRTYIAPEKWEGLKKHTLMAGDILFSSFVDEEVRVCLLPDELHGKAINKADCFCVRTDRVRCLPAFLVLRLACRATFEALNDAVHGATRPRINLGQLRDIQFRLPSVPEQQEIVDRAMTLLSCADNLERRLALVERLVANTTPSAIAKAFRGELVPQDPNDEPGSDLRARIRTQQAVRGAAPKPKTGKRRTSAKAGTDMPTRNVTPNHLTNILIERGALTAEALWTASKLEIDEFYDQLKAEEARGLLRERRGDSPTAPRRLEAAA